eukprot:COSAG01_NODE_24_length_37608_cov_19.303154_12_plen_98_part_00
MNSRGHAVRTRRDVLGSVAPGRPERPPLSPSAAAQAAQGQLEPAPRHVQENHRGRGLPEYLRQTCHLMIRTGSVTEIPLRFCSNNLHEDSRLAPHHH